MREKRFEILDGLPPYGPMYIPISIDEEPFVSEGYVVKFYKSNGEDWVANFKPGWTDYSNIFDFPEHDSTIVIAGGLGYIMTPENERPKTTFGMSIKNVIQTDGGSLICADDTHILILNNETGEFWESERISWDGIKDLKINNNNLTGQSYDPTNLKMPWSDFSINLDTKVIEGGSFQIFLTNNPHIESNKTGLIKESQVEKNKDW
jgi:hypothetical protein